eukprot:5389003-Amphidinium_carterae.1
MLCSCSRVLFADHIEALCANRNPCKSFSTQQKRGSGYAPMVLSIPDCVQKVSRAQCVHSQGSTSRSSHRLNRQGFM